MKGYIVKLKHDDGFHEVAIAARDALEAMKAICHAENAPHRAVVSVREVR